MKHVIAAFLLLLLWSSLAQAALSLYSVTLSDNRPSRVSTILLEFTTTQTIPAGGTITTYFPNEWSLDSTVAPEASMGVNVNGTRQALAAQASTGIFGVTQSGREVTLTLPQATSIASGASFSILYGTSGKWYTPPSAGTYAISTAVRTSNAESVEHGASYVVIAEGVGLGGQNDVVYPSSSAAATTEADTAADSDSAADTNAPETGEDGQAVNPADGEDGAQVQEGEGETTESEAAPPREMAQEAADVELGGEEGINAVDVAQFVLLVESTQAEAAVDFNADGVANVQDLGVLVSLWTDAVAPASSFARFDVGPPLAVDQVVFDAYPMHSLRASASSIEERTTLALTVSTGETPVNVVDVAFSLSDSGLYLEEIYTNESIVTVWVEEPYLDGDVVRFVGAIPGGFSGSGAPLVLLEFAGSEEEVISSVAYSNETEAVYDDGAGTLASVFFEEVDASAPTTSSEDETEASEPSVSTTIESASAPSVDCPTHPDPYQWYAQSSPSCGWDASEDDTGYSFVIDHELDTVPDAIQDTSEPSMSLESLSDGEWMLHVRRLCNVCDEGATGHRLMRIDTTPPAPFEVQTGYATFLWEAFPFVLFDTTDTMSGVAYYIVDVHGAQTIVTQGPFVLSLDQDGWYRVDVTAVDRAGNKETASTNVLEQSGALGHSRSKTRLALWVIAAVALLTTAGLLIARRRRHV